VTGHLQQSPAEGWLDRYGPWAFVVLGVAMIAVATVDYLDASVGVAFVVLGAGLLALGGLASRLQGTIKLGLQGVEMALAARQAVVAAQRTVEQSNPEAARRLGATIDNLDGWFEEYQRRVANTPGMYDPFARAALMQSVHDEYGGRSSGGEP
jgi:hypothetical protein